MSQATAKPLANVVAYADDKLVGKAKAGPDGHFVIDGVMPLSVGDHKIRVDVLDDAGKVAVARLGELQPSRKEIRSRLRRKCQRPMPEDTAAMVPLDEGALGS